MTGSPRRASNPANALLNYLYAVIEAEARLAALAVGCDPGLGLLHADQKTRDSLACDLMEPVRPAVDVFVFETLSSRVFRRREFFETRDGVCRVLPPLTRLLAETASRWALALAPIAERVARRLADSATNGEDSSRPVRPIKLPTPLTEAKRRAGRDAVRRRQRSKALAPTGDLPQNCLTCGATLQVAGRTLCDACIPEPKTAIRKCHDALRERRAEGTDPSHGGSAAAARAARRVESQRAITDWEAKNPMPPDQAAYSRDVLPRLKSVSVPAIVCATGLSYPYCALIRRGLRVPHPMHWETLAWVGRQTYAAIGNRHDE